MFVYAFAAIDACNANNVRDGRGVSDSQLSF
jgi:hypothetical protein